MPVTLFDLNVLVISDAAVTQLYENDPSRRDRFWVRGATPRICPYDYPTDYESILVIASSIVTWATIDSDAKDTLAFFQVVETRIYKTIAVVLT